MKPHHIAAAVFAALTLAASPAAAQIGVEGGPMDIRAERMETIDADATVLLIGAVDILQGRSRLRADRVEVIYTAGEDGTDWSEIQRINADGNVYYVTPEEVARGDRAVYELSEDTITMTGEVVVTRCEDVITGDRLVMNITTGDSVFTSEAAGADAPAGSRVRLVLFPAEENGEDASPRPQPPDARGCPPSGENEDGTGGGA